MVFPDVLAKLPGVYGFGASGCGQADKQNSRGQLFPLACWEMSSEFWNPFTPHTSEREQQLAIRVLAEVQHMETAEEVNRRVQHLLDSGVIDRRFAHGVAEQIGWNHYFVARKVPIIHHAGFGSVHRLARELLQP